MAVKKISISMDKQLYTRLNRAAAMQKRTFSNFIAHIAETMLPAYEKKQVLQTPAVYVVAPSQEKTRTKRT
jgi:metal-responsive CopG/Arc/MetJ family transcriptional regulator